MEVDTATSAVQPSGKSTLPELEIYCYLIVLLFLIDQKLYNKVCFVQMSNVYVPFLCGGFLLISNFENLQAKSCASASIACLKSLKRRVADVLASKLYSFYSLSYELTGDLAEIRGQVFAIHS